MRILIILGIVSLFFSCKKETEAQKYITYPIDLEPLAYYENGFVCTATKEVLGLGSIPWKANCEAWKVQNKLAMSINTYADTVQHFERETIGFDNFLLQLGKQNVVSNASWQQNQELVRVSYALSLADGDVTDAFYEIDEAKENYISLDEINLDQKYIKGRFNLHFLQITQGQQNLHSERINFVNAQFTARIIN